MNILHVLDKGFLRLEEIAGSDLSIVNAAKVSFDKRADSMGETEKRILNFLIREKHETPIEKNYLQFHVKAPKVVFSEWHRHRIGVSISEVSGRYVSFADRDFYIPNHLRVQKGKPGDYYFEQLDEEDNEQSLHREFQRWLKWMDDEFRRGYKYFEEKGIAKEQLRLPIPFHFYSEMIWSCNVRSLMHFLTLRLGRDAMWEIRQYAHAMAFFFAKHFPVTWDAFKRYRLKDIMDSDEFGTLPGEENERGWSV